MTLTRVDIDSLSLAPSTLEELKANNYAVWRDEYGKCCYLAKNGELKEV